MSPDDWAALIVAAAVVLADFVIARGRRKHWTDVAYGYGTIDGLRIGDRRSYTRGYSQACLDHVLAAPAAADDFTEALLSGALHEPVGEDMAALLGAVQEHERAARTEATACRTCKDTGQVWTPEQDDSGMWDMACPDCDTPYPLPDDAPHPMAPEFDDWEAASRHTASRMNRGAGR